MVILPIVAVAQDGAKKVSRAEGASAATQKVSPDYPVIAKQLKIQGEVVVEALVGESGSVETVNIVSGNAALTKSAVDAMKKWKFTPFTADGKPTKALVPVSFDFKL
jgi:protein TonB